MSDTNNTPGDNPLFNKTGLPKFDQIAAEHVVPAVEKLLETSQAVLEKLEADVKPTWAGVVEKLDEMGRPFEQTWGPVSHLLGVKNSSELRTAHETVLGPIVAFSMRAKQSQPIYGALKALREGDEWSQLDGAQQRIVEQKLLSAELAGIALPEAEQKRFNEIAAETSRLGTEFSNHVLDATKAFSHVIKDKSDVEGLPESLLQLTSQSYNEQKADDEAESTAENGPWRITLDNPCVGPFMQHCKNRELREKLYRALISRAASGDLDNTQIIDELLKLRQEKAALLGYKNFAEISLAEKMAPDVDTIQEMLEKLRAASWDAAGQDMKELTEHAKEAGAQQLDDGEPLAHWDISFWAERLREKRFQFTDEELRPYFSLERVLEGLFGIVNRIFGITVKAADGEAAVWQKDVRFFNIYNESNEQIASFYLDPYSRPEDKRGGAWMDDCLTRRYIDGKLQLPVAHLVCNSTPPVGDKPSLMTFREVETLFHEFGHGLQHMMTTVDYPDAAGISGVEWDAVELPSQFMENWCYHRPTLIGMTSHYETGEPLPDDLFEKICAARTFRAGSGMLRQLTFGITDLLLHSEFDPNGSETVFDVQRRVTEKTSVLPMLPENKFLCSFQHIFAGGYAAGYYSYKWAEVLSADAFGAFEEAGLDNEQAIVETGHRFRDTILSQGGSKHPMELFKEFRGREPQPEALLRHSGLTPA